MNGSHVNISEPLNAFGGVYINQSIKIFSTASISCNFLLMCTVSQRPIANYKEDVIYKNIEENWNKN